MTDRTVLDGANVVPLRPKPADEPALSRLRLLGEVHCLAPDISETEFLGVLARGGLCISTVDQVQLIHRIPRASA